MYRLIPPNARGEFWAVVFWLRLRPETRLLLDDAAQAQRRSRASLVDQAIVEMLAGRFARVENRLDQMLGTK